MKRVGRMGGIALAAVLASILVAVAPADAQVSARAPSGRTAGEPPMPRHVPPLEDTFSSPHVDVTSTGSVTFDAKGNGSLTVIVTPKPGMHLYAPGAEGYTPFTLTVEVPKGLSATRIVYPEPGLYIFPPTGEASRAYVKPFRVTVPLTASAELQAQLKGPKPPVTGVIGVRYQACDDKVCYRPGRGAFTFSIR